MANRTNFFTGGTPYEDPDADTGAGPGRIISSYVTVGDSSSVNPRKDKAKKILSTGSDITRKKTRFRRAMNGGVFYQAEPSFLGIAPPANFNSEFTGSVPGDDASMNDDIECDCFEEHPYNFACPNRPYLCNACWNVHRSGRCPYFDRLPQGATFNNNGYEIICACGNMFIEDKWACTACGGDWAVLKDKYCHICNSRAQHGSYECPKDKVRAAQYKMVRDERRSRVRVRIPYNPESLSSEMTYTP